MKKNGKHLLEIKNYALEQNYKINDIHNISLISENENV